MPTDPISSIQFQIDLRKTSTYGKWGPRVWALKGNRKTQNGALAWALEGNRKKRIAYRRYQFNSLLVFFYSGALTSAGLAKHRSGVP